MYLTISQAAVSKLPGKLIQNSAFVKHVDLNPVHESGQADSPAEKIHGDAHSRFDSVSISAEGLRSWNISRLSYADGSEELSLDTAAGDLRPFVERQPDAVVDITTPEAEEKKSAADAVGRYMRGWNHLIAQLKEESESKDYSYDQTIELFKSQTRLWEKNLQKTDPEAWQEWQKKLAEWGVKWL